MSAEMVLPRLERAKVRLEQHVCRVLDGEVLEELLYWDRPAVTGGILSSYDQVTKSPCIPLDRRCIVALLKGRRDYLAVEAPVVSMG